MYKKVDVTNIWIKLALSDLKASKILYEQKQFRSSYFLFQQASEKANKAFLLKFGLAKEEDLKDMGHNQFKIDRKIVAEKIEELNGLLRNGIKLSPKLEKKYSGLKKSLSTIDSLKTKNIMNLSSIEINSIYKEISILRIPFQKRNPRIKQIFREAKESKNAYIIALALLQWSLDLAFIKLAIMACSILTTQHSTLTRYPENGRDPTEIYTMKLTLIKKQPLFMDLLDDAIRKLKIYSDENIFNKILKTKNVYE